MLFWEAVVIVKYLTIRSAVSTSTILREASVQSGGWEGEGRGGKRLINNWIKGWGAGWVGHLATTLKTWDRATTRRERWLGFPLTSPSWEEGEVLARPDRKYTTYWALQSPELHHHTQHQPTSHPSSRSWPAWWWWRWGQWLLLSCCTVWYYQ